MKIGFVFAPYGHKRFSENLSVVDDDFGVFPPINLAYAAAIAEEAGHEVMMVDAKAEGLSLGQAIGRLESFQPAAVGFYFTTYMFHDTLAWAREIKKALGVTILGGGINLLLYPRESLHEAVIDYGIAGQAVETLPLLLEALEEGRTPSIPGVCYRQGEEIIYHPPSSKRYDFDAYPFPARHLLPVDRYYSFTSQLRNFTIMITAMGCRHRCSFCAIAPLLRQTRSPESVLDEMQLCVDRFGVREIDIFDPDFPFDRQRTEQICRGIRERGLELEWSCRACTDSVDADLLRLMHAAGCRKIYFGIETPSEQSLRLMDKKITLERVHGIMSDARRVGIRPLGFFMTGVPGETRRSLLDTIRFALSLELDFAQFSRTIAKPGSELSHKLALDEGRDFWREYVLGRQHEERLGSPWTELSEAEIEWWTKAAYFLFYFRPGAIARAVGRVRSFEELARGIRTALRMIGSSSRHDTD